MKKHKKLTKAISLYFILVNLFIGVAVFIGACYSFYFEMREITLSKVQQVAYSKSDAIAEWLRLATMTASLPANKKLTHVLMADYYKNKISEDKISRLIARVLEEFVVGYEDIEGVICLDKDSRLLAEAGRNIPREYWPKMVNGQLTPLTGIYGNAAGRASLIVSSPILNDDGTYLGANVFIFDSDAIERLVTEENSLNLTHDSSLFFMRGSEASLVFSTNKIDPPRLSAQLVNQIKTGAARQTIFQKDTTVAISQVEDSDWLMVVSIPTARLYAPIFEYLLYAISFFTLFFSLALLGLWFLVIKPLATMVARTTGALEEAVAEKDLKLFEEQSGRKKTEDRLIFATHRAAVAQKAKDQFLTNLSHEIRTPMNAIIGMTDLALFTDLTEEQRNYLNEVKTASDHLLLLINTLLDLSKLEAGILVFESRDFDLSAMIESLKAGYQPVAEAKGLDFIVETAPDLPQWVRGDQLKIQQVLRFLLDNAFKFTDSGFVRLSIGPDHAPDALEFGYLFEVEDSGSGIDPDKLDFIFEPFSQNEAWLTKKDGGAGMGLAVTKKLINLMGGQISALSTPGQGSRFTFSLSMPEAVMTSEQYKIMQVKLSAAQLKGKMAVVADDNTVNRFILKKHLDGLQIESNFFENGLTAINYLQTHKKNISPDVFIMDVSMPGLDVNELKKKLWEIFPSTPILFMSSEGVTPGEIFTETFPSVQAQFLTLHLDKPVSKQELEDGLAMLIGRTEALFEQSDNLKLRNNLAVCKSDKKNKIGRCSKALKILVVDDNALNQKLVATILLKRGHNITVASNGQEALDALASELFDVALMDIQMPVMDGLTAVRHIRQEPQKYGGDLPVIAITAHALPGDQEKFISAGMNAYVSKPFKPADLISIIEQTKIGNEIVKGDGSVTSKLDKASVLDNFMDDEELLFESIDLFLERVMSRLDTLAEGVASREAEKVMIEAHTLKGMIGVFSTGDTFEAAKELELMGRNGNLDGVDDAFRVFKEKLEKLNFALRDWRSNS